MFAVVVATIVVVCAVVAKTRLKVVMSLVNLFRFFSSLNLTKKLLFRNKRFMLDEMFQRNASKFVLFMEYENPHR